MVTAAFAVAIVLASGKLRWRLILAALTAVAIACAVAGQFATPEIPFRHADEVFFVGFIVFGAVPTVGSLWRSERPEGGLADETRKSS